MATKAVGDGTVRVGNRVICEACGYDSTVGISEDANKLPFTVKAKTVACWYSHIGKEASDYVLRNMLFVFCPICGKKHEFYAPSS